ncbi:retrovirus-related pol polyprotein from transposon TNT 1-94 [Tanacetum coccineum]
MLLNSSAERWPRMHNPLALVATAQTMQDPYYQTPKHHKSYAPTSKASLPTRSHAATRYKGKEIAKLITPPSESASEQKTKLYKPTNNNIRTSSNFRNKNVDTTPRYKNDNQTGQFGNQRAINVVGARETVGGPVVQQSGIQCFNCKEFGHYAKECRKPKRVRDSTVGSTLLLVTMAKIQDLVLMRIRHNDAGHGNRWKESERVIVNVIPDSPDMCDNDIQNDQHDVDCDDERVALANLIANLKLDVDDNKKIQSNLRNQMQTLIKIPQNGSYDPSNQDSSSVVEEILTLAELVEKILPKCKGKSVDTKFDKPSVVRQPNAQRIPKPSVLGKPAPFSNSLERKYFTKKKSVLKTNESESLSKPVTLQNLPQTAMQAVRNTNVIKPGMYRIASSNTQTRAPQLNQTFRNTNPRASTFTGVAHTTNVSRPQPRSNQMKDKVVPYTSHAKLKKTEVEEHRLDVYVFLNTHKVYLIQGNITIKRVYYEGLNHNLFSVGQFCDADLEVAFRKSTCFVRDLQGNDLLTGNRGFDLYTISLQDNSSTPSVLWL